MGFGSWLTRAVDVVTPWNRGGEVQRRYERKRREDEEYWQQQNQYRPQQQNFNNFQQNGAVQADQQPELPKPQRPDDLFKDLNKALTLNQPKNVLGVTKNQDTQVVKKPKPGTVIKPTISLKAINRGLDAGKSWEQISRETGIPLANVRAFSKGTRPNYGISSEDQLKTKLQERLPSNASIFTRSVKSVGSNLAGGFLGGVKAVVELPSAALSTPKLIRYGAAKVTRNKQAEENIANDEGNLSKLAEKYSRFVSPVTRKLTKAEEATDVVAEKLSPGRPGYIKPGVKVLSNLIPLETLLASVTGLSKARNTRRLIKEGEAAVGAAGTAGTISRGVRIPVARGIDVAEKGGEAISIPVRDTSPLKPQGNIIREIGGDAPNVTRVPTRMEAAENRATNRFRNQDFGIPDKRIEGVTPRTSKKPFALSENDVKIAQDKLIDDYAAMLRDLGEGNGVAINPETGIRMSSNYRPGMGNGRITKAQWRDEAERQLRDGKAESSVQKAFNETSDPEVQALLNEGDQANIESGRPIKVQEARGIPVRDETVVPTNLPEIPGTVRVTSQTSPMADKTKVAAETQQVYAESSKSNIPVVRDTANEYILNNPKRFNKRQVAAARNQRKLARQMAKTQEDTAEALDRIQTISPAAQSGEGFVPTGEFGKSAQGGAYQKTSRAAEMQTALEETSQLSPADVIQTARKNQLETGDFNRRDVRNVAALFESKRIPRGTPEWQAAREILKEDGTVWGQTGALRNYTMRRTASANELIGRYESKIYRLADDPTKIDSKLFDEVEAAEDVYVQARDDALLAYNRFTENPTSANTKAYHAAQDAADKADKAAKITEYRVADQALKKNKDVKQARELEKMANDADLYQMDAVDASMLSGTGTFVRNLANAAVGGVEEGVFGRPAAWLSRKFTGESIGGGAGKGTIKGFKEGAGNVIDVSKARAANAGKNPLEHIKNWATTGNQLGDAVIDSQTLRNTLAHYTHSLKEQGYKGRELTDRASVMARQDPENIGRMYAHAARTAAGLGGGITRNNKIEGFIKNIVSDAISFGSPNAASEATAKLITRMTVGFPTAIGRSTAEGVKRFTLGTPTFLRAAATKDPAQRALLIKEGIKQAGSGSMVVPPLFYALGANGLITGAYPSDPDERARWEREGITENSIKIGGAYYQLPAYLGAWAVPGLFYASLGRNEGDFGAAAADTAKAVPAILPTDNISNWLDVINGRSDPGKFVTQTGASAVRAATPAGALLNQISKSFDPTKNDTNSGAMLENFVDKVLSGIPGVNNMADIPTKKDDAGNEIQNPNAAELLFGAASAVQGKGEERSNQLAAEVDKSLKSLSDLGLLDDPNLDGVLQDTGLEALNKVRSGESLDESEVKALKEGLVKGVSSEGTDTAYLERGQYDTNLAVLKLKRELMSSDPTVKPSSLKDIDVAIKRGGIYKDNQIPYDMIQSYKDTSLTEWRDMGDPEDEDYNPEMYEKLWAIDEIMSKAGVSYKLGNLKKAKYYARKQGSGRGRGGRDRSGVRAIDSSFGTLKDGTFAPRVQQYAGIEAQAGAIPHIPVMRPNIVHKISSSG